MFIWVISVVISTASAKAPVIAKPMAVSTAPQVESFRKPYYSFLRVQSQIIGQLGQRTIHPNSAPALKQKFEVVRKDYRNLRADVVAPKFDVAKVGAGIRQYRQNFNSFVASVPVSDQKAATNLRMASDQSMRYLVSAVDRIAPTVAGKKSSDAPALVTAMGGPQTLGLPRATDPMKINYAALAPGMALNNGVPLPQTLNPQLLAVTSDASGLKATATVAGDGTLNELTTKESDNFIAPSVGGPVEANQAKIENKVDGQPEGPDAKPKAEQQAVLDNKDVLSTEKNARKIDPNSKDDLDCLARGNIAANGSCSSGGSLDKIGYKEKGNATCESRGGGNMCDPAFYYSSSGAACVSGGTKCSEVTRDITNVPPKEYTDFLQRNKATVEAKIARIRETCENQSSAQCQEMLNRANSIEVWMGWNGGRYQNVASNPGKKPPVSTGVWNSGWLQGGSRQDASIVTSPYGAGQVRQ